jgi:hypothetical protein
MSKSRNLSAARAGASRIDLGSWEGNGEVQRAVHSVSFKNPSIFSLKEDLSVDSRAGKWQAGPKFPGGDGMLVFGFLGNDMDVHSGRFSKKSMYGGKIEILPPVIHRGPAEDYLRDVF